MSWSLFSGLARDSSVAASIFAKASFVGAKTVKGPGPDSVSTRSAAFGGLRREREREGDNTLHACKMDLRETG